MRGLTRKIVVFVLQDKYNFFFSFILHFYTSLDFFLDFVASKQVKKYIKKRYGSTGKISWQINVFNTKS